MSFIYNPSAGGGATPDLQAVTTAGNTSGNQIALNYDITSASPASGALSNAATVNNDAAPSALGGFHNTLTVNYSAGASTVVPPGVYNSVIFNNPNNSPLVDLTGLNFIAQHNSVATIDDIFGIRGTVGMTGGGVADAGIGVLAGYANTSGTLTNYSDFSSSSVVNGTLTNYYFNKAVAPTVGGTLTNLYGLYIPTWTAGSNNYPIWLEDVGGVFFRNSATKVHSSAAGQLDLTAATTVKINTAQLVLPNYSLPLADGTANYILKTDGAGTVTWQPDTGGSGSPGGLDTEIQFNNAGSFDGIAGLTYDGTDITHGAGLFRHADNISETFGTSDIWSQYSDGTDLIIERNSGTGELKLGASMDKDIRLNKIGLGATAISTSFFINLVTSGNARGGMQFDYTATGTNPLINLFLKGTSQHTNVSPTTGGAQASIIKNEDSSLGYATTNPTYFGFYAQLGTSNASTVSAGTQKFYGFRADMTALGRGTANTGGDILTYGLKIEPTLAYSGVASQVDYGVFSAEDIGIIAGARIGFNDTETAKGTTYMSYVAADSELYTYANAVKAKGVKSDRVNFYVPPTNMGISKGVTMAIARGFGV